MKIYKNMIVKIYELYTDLSRKPEATFGTMKEALNYGNNLGVEEFYIQEKIVQFHKHREDER